MTTFDDLVFHPRFPVEEYALLEDKAPTVFAELRDAQFAYISFPNGYSASILFGSIFYSNGIDTYELAVFDPDGITYDTPITNDVLNYITKDKVTSALQQIEALPSYSKD